MPVRTIALLLLFATRSLAQTDTVRAQYAGGPSAWSRYLMRNLLNDLSSKGAPAGTYLVRVDYTIDTSGNIVNVIPQNNPGYGTMEEAVSIIKNSGRWTPATLNNKKIETIGHQTFSFLVLPPDHQKHDSNYWKIKLDSNSHQLYRYAMHIDNNKADSVIAVEREYGKSAYAMISDTSIPPNDKGRLVLQFKDKERESIKKLLTDEQYGIWIKLDDHSYLNSRKGH